MGSELENRRGTITGILLALAILMSLPQQVESANAAGEGFPFPPWISIFLETSKENEISTLSPEDILDRHPPGFSYLQEDGTTVPAERGIGAFGPVTTIIGVVKESGENGFTIVTRDGNGEPVEIEFDTSDSEEILFKKVEAGVLKTTEQTGKPETKEQTIRGSDLPWFLPNPGGDILIVWGPQSGKFDSGLEDLQRHAQYPQYPLEDLNPVSLRNFSMAVPN